MNIHKSEDNSVLFGVLGGLGEYFGVDPVLLRVIVVLIAFASGGFPVFIVYLILAIAMPDEPRDQVEDKRRKRYDNFFGRMTGGQSPGSKNKRKKAEDVRVEDEEEDDDWSDF